MSALLTPSSPSSLCANLTFPMRQTLTTVNLIKLNVLTDPPFPPYYLNSIFSLSLFIFFLLSFHFFIQLINKSLLKTYCMSTTLLGRVIWGEPTRCDHCLQWRIRSTGEKHFRKWSHHIYIQTHTHKNPTNLLRSPKKEIFSTRRKQQNCDLQMKRS